MKGAIRVFGPSPEANSYIGQELAGKLRAEFVSDTLSGHTSVTREGVARMLCRGAGLMAMRGVVVMGADPIVDEVVERYAKARAGGALPEAAGQALHAQLDLLHGGLDQFLRGATVVNMYVEPADPVAYSLGQEAFQAVGSALESRPGQPYVPVFANDDPRVIASRMTELLA